MSFYENLILCGGVIPRFVNSIMKVDTPKKRMLYVTVIILWFDDNGVQSCIDEASVIEILSSRCIVVPAPYGTIYLVDINGTCYWGSI